MFIRTTALTLLTIIAAIINSAQTSALPTQVVHADTPDCDPLFIPLNVHELGDAAIFPPDEALTHADRGTISTVPCPQHNDPNTPEVLVEITNVSGLRWDEVWYVANPETTITNFDGEANDILFPPLQEAFRIDNLASDPTGSHHPLVFESMTPDGIWEIGEIWHFILQDYSNSIGLPPDALDSLGIGSASGSASGITSSSGSIIAVRVPEPTTAVLLALGLIGGLAPRFRRV